MEPLDRIKEQLDYRHAMCTAIDFEKKVVHCQLAMKSEEGFEVSYDQLILAVGAKSNSLGIKGVDEHAFFLKEIKDAKKIKARILELFESASKGAVSEEKRKEMLHFTVVGGGPTGIEFAAELHDLLVKDLAKKYGKLAKLAHITLFDTSSRILGGFHESLSEYVLKEFNERSGIEVVSGRKIVEVQADKVIFEDGTSLKTGMTLWATGLTGVPLVAELGKKLPMDTRKFRILTNDMLQVIDGQDTPMDGVYAIGDCATIKAKNYPCTAQVAKRKALYLLDALNAIVAPSPFEFVSGGMLAYIGNGRAIADLGTKQIMGLMAGIIWKKVYYDLQYTAENKKALRGAWLHSWWHGRDLSKPVI